MFKQLNVGVYLRTTLALAQLGEFSRHPAVFGRPATDQPYFSSVNHCDVLHAKRWWASDGNHWPQKESARNTGRLTGET